MAIYSKADREIKLSHTETSGPKFVNLGPGRYFNVPTVIPSTSK